jgi:hypothetical protein
MLALYSAQSAHQACVFLPRSACSCASRVLCMLCGHVHAVRRTNPNSRAAHEQFFTAAGICKRFSAFALRDDGSQRREPAVAGAAAQATTPRGVGRRWRNTAHVRWAAQRGHSVLLGADAGCPDEPRGASSCRLAFARARGSARSEPRASRRPGDLSQSRHACGGTEEGHAQSGYGLFAPRQDEAFHVQDRDRPPLNAGSGDQSGSSSRRPCDMMRRVRREITPPLTGRGAPCPLPSEREGRRGLPARHRS